MSKNFRGVGEETPPIFEMSKLLVSLDIATNMGVIYHQRDSGVYYATTYKGSPVEQLEMLLDVLGDDVKGVSVFYEELNTFRNANTTRNILHRVGYLKNSLLADGAEFQPVNAVQARKFLGFKDKEAVGKYFSAFGLNQDEADAMVVLLFAKAQSLDLLEGEKIVCLR